MLSKCKVSGIECVGRDYEWLTHSIWYLLLFQIFVRFVFKNLFVFRVLAPSSLSSLIFFGFCLAEKDEAEMKYFILHTLG